MMNIYNYRRINWQIELLNLILLSSEIVLGYQNNLISRLMPGIIVQLFSYLLLTLIFYLVLGPKVLFHKTKTLVPVKRIEISGEESLRYIKRGVLFLNSTKLVISFLITSVMLIDIYFHNSIYALTCLTFLLCILFLLIVQFTKNAASAQGYVLANNKELLRNFVFYYNPSDTRTSVDKPLGIGSTINLATKDGKIVIAVILAIPILFITTLIIVLAVAGKL